MLASVPLSDSVSVLGFVQQRSCLLVVGLQLDGARIGSSGGIRPAQRRLHIAQLGEVACVVLSQSPRPSELSLGGGQMVVVDRRDADLLVVVGLKRVEPGGGRMVP